MLNLIRQANQNAHLKIVVLDDDPTGCQTVHAVPILISWEDELLQKTLETHDLVFILTNTRAFSAEKAGAVTAEIVAKLKHLIPLHQLRIISRSDSTLRGHFWSETQAITTQLPTDGLLVIPFFEEGGRVTKNSTHYLKVNEQEIEVSQTEFAQDTVFGFKNSYLPDWIEEKTQGQWRSSQVVCITLEEIRTDDAQDVMNKLMQIQNATPIVIDTEKEDDLVKVVKCITDAEARGKRFVYRTAASFVKVRAGMTQRPLVTPQKTGKVGLIIVGSYVAKSTSQLQYLLEHTEVKTIEIEAKKVLSNASTVYCQELGETIENTLNQRQTALIYTQRRYLFEHLPKEQQLIYAQKISDFVCDLVSNLHTRPDFMIAKGGITSLEIARRGLSVSLATVVGQIAQGVPIWELGDESKFPSMPYVVFPGNVGDETTLDEVFKKFN